MLWASLNQLPIHNYFILNVSSNIKSIGIALSFRRYLKMRFVLYQRILFQLIAMTIFLSHVYAGLNFQNSPYRFESGDPGFMKNLEKRGWNPKQLASEFDTENAIEDENNVERDEEIIELMRNFPELLQMHMDFVNMGKRGFNPNGYTRYIQMLRRRTGAANEREHGKRNKKPNQVDDTKASPFKSQIKTYFKFRTKNEYPSLNFGKRGFNPNSYAITNRMEPEDGNSMETQDEDERSNNTDALENQQ